MSSPLAVAAADDAAALLAKHLAYTGWQLGDATMSAVDETETVARKDEKPPRTVRRIRRLGAAYRIDTHDVKANIDYTSGFTGRLFWYADQNWFVVPVIGPQARLSLAEDLLFVDGLAQLAWVQTGTKRMWNKLYTVIRVHQDYAGNIDIFVDPDTGAYGGIVFDPGGDNETTLRVLAYSDVAPQMRNLSISN